MIMKHYAKSDSVRVNYCGEDLSTSTTGKVVFVDREHLIVRFEFYNRLAVYGLNRQFISDGEIENIIEKPRPSARTKMTYSST